MCVTAIIGTILSTAVSAMGAYQQSKAQQASLRYQAAIATNNAIAARQNSAAIAERADRAEDDHRRKIAASKGTWRADVAGRGILVDDQDATVDYELQNIAQFGEYDVAKIHDNAKLRMRDAEIQGQNFDTQAALKSFDASNINPMMAAGGVLLKGAGAVGSMYTSAGYTGIFSPAKAGGKSMF